MQPAWARTGQPHRCTTRAEAATSSPAPAGHHVLAAYFLFTPTPARDEGDDTDIDLGFTSSAFCCNHVLIASASSPLNVAKEPTVTVSTAVAVKNTVTLPPLDRAS